MSTLGLREKTRDDSRRFFRLHGAMQDCKALLKRLGRATILASRQRLTWQRCEAMKAGFLLSTACSFLLCSKQITSLPQHVPCDDVVTRDHQITAEFVEIDRTLLMFFAFCRI